MLITCCCLSESLPGPLSLRPTKWHFPLLQWRLHPVIGWLNVRNCGYGNRKPAFNRCTELPWPDLPLPIQILFNIRLLLGKNHWEKYLQLGKTIGTINSDMFLGVVIKESWVVVTDFRRSVLKTGMPLYFRFMKNSIQHLTEQRQTEEMLFAFWSSHLKKIYIYPMM